MRLVVKVIIVVNVFAFLVALADKFTSKFLPRNGRVKSRVPETSFIGLCLLGGFPGFIFACLLCNHKLKKGAFLARCAVAYLGFLFVTNLL